ncbi:MAG: beta-propeller fold lactonase family protein [Thermoanaerobaculia bacterium]
MSSHVSVWSRGLAACLVGAVAVAGAARAEEPPKTPPPAAAPQTQKVVREGIALEMTVEPVGKAGVLMEGADARVTLKLTDQLTGNPLTGVYPGAWMDSVAGKAGAEGEAPADCKKKVEAFIGGSILSRPAMDLNVYYVLALNEDATISVVDPLFGYGSSKLLTMVFLESPGEDWALVPGGERLFVSMPAVNKVAVVETSGWKLETDLATGPHPRRLLLQPDGQYLWAATDAGVTVLDARRLRRAADIPTGKGGHDLAFSDDSRFAFVTNETDGTVSVIDVAKLAKVRDVAVGPKPVSIAWSTQAKAAYVASAGDGVISAIDGASAKPLARVTISPGISEVRFAPGGRLAFVVHPNQNTIHIVDAASNRLIQTADVEKEPDQVSFSDELAYVRHRGSETVLMIPLKTVGEAGKPVAVVDFPGGQNPPGRMPRPSPADGIVQAPGAAAVLVANPADKVIYFYKEGMAAPMGHFQNYGKQPLAALVVDRSLREVRPGVYQTTAKMAGAGDYELALFLDSPRLFECFPVKLAENPVLAASRKPALDIQPAIDRSTVGVGEDVAVRFKISDPRGGKPRTGLKDVRVLTFLSPGIWQQRQWATDKGEGLYEVHFTPPEAGVYFVFLEVSSAGIPFQKSPFVVLTAEGGSR